LQSISPEMLEVLAAAVKARISLLISRSHRTELANAADEPHTEDESATARL